MAEADQSGEGFLFSPRRSPEALLRVEACGGLEETQRTGKSDCRMWENKSEGRNAAGLWGTVIVNAQGVRGTRGVTFPRAGLQGAGAD